MISNLDNLKNLNDSETFISLDVVSLYPSVPLELALEVIDNFARKYWTRINNFGLSKDDFKKCLRFVTYNYEITFNGSVYLQVSGVPVGTHFAPPFAVIFMDYIENIALTTLEAKNIKPRFYKRYIDCLLYTSPSPRDLSTSRMPSSA